MGNFFNFLPAPVSGPNSKALGQNIFDEQKGGKKKKKDQATTAAEKPLKAQRALHLDEDNHPFK